VDTFYPVDQLQRLQASADDHKGMDQYSSDQEDCNIEITYATEYLKWKAYVTKSTDDHRKTIDLCSLKFV
jgi:hypothetical protein